MASLESCNPSILVAMERLWFHKIVLCSEQNICPNKTPPIEIMSPSLSSSSSSSSSDQVSSNSSSEPTDYSDDDDIIQDFSFAVHGSLPTILATHHQQMDYEDEDDEKEKLEQEDDIKELIPTRATRPNVVMKRAKSSKTPIRRRIKSARLRLERTLSCKTLGELEQEEVKGFMDLGFIFDKERLTPRMMSVVPGLQRLQGKEEEEEDNNGVEARQDEDDMKMVEGEAKKKPYLSEAWLIKRSDSPLVRLRMSRPSTTTNDMKKHLKIWAKTVAYSAIKE